MLSRFDALGDQIGRLLDVDEAVVDGEVIAADETGRPVFIDLLRRKQTPTYVAFDILWLVVPTCDICRSTSAAVGCKRFCRRSH